MAFDFYMNMEKLAVTAAEKHIACMTDDNFFEGCDCFLDDDKLLNNMENGFVVITLLSCYVESFLNTVMNSCIGYQEEALLKCSVPEKLDIIFLYYGKDFSAIKSQNSWAAFRRVTKVRNEMIHFKKTFVGLGTGIPDFALAGEKVSAFFTRNNMEKLLAEHIKLAKAIASELGLKIYEQINVFECAGRDQLVNYVYDEDLCEIDETRFT